ncbi:hypothetical protein BT96DRAFT_485286 [Gymnopus androsaceus JB14]|uniref:Uncharacterized protein n=1 Tax=Gymnopus androsaceus JB14 TaxID=1447944 RepID=A0A6A4GNS9_9AGAR|nr:hypothetical protein BT96DRAFT_485286 [Gymnopus androsaceus JB14]
MQVMFVPTLPHYSVLRHPRLPACGDVPDLLVITSSHVCRFSGSMIFTIIIVILTTVVLSTSLLLSVYQPLVY